MGIGVNTLGSFKLGGYCGLSAEEAFNNIEYSLKSVLCVMV